MELEWGKEGREGVPFVHLCIRSPMFITMASLSGVASTNSPGLWGFSIWEVG